MRVLIAEDDHLLRAAAERVLREAGVAVYCASDGWKACDLVEAQTFDAAVVDFQMPGPNGLEVLGLLEQVQPRCARILASGGLTLDIAVKAVNSGQVAYVMSKPYAPSQLIESVRMSVSRRERERTSGEHSLAADWLDECLSDGSIHMALQPIVRASDGKPFGYEALLRCSHPQFRSPLELVQAARDNDRLDQLGSVVAAGAGAWLAQLPDDERVFINLHPDELQDSDLLCRRLSGLTGFGDRVVLEITEQSDLASSPNSRKTIRTLERQGFSIAVDDLGAGYSSLSMLADLAPTIIKIDMSIVRDVDSDPRKRRLMRLLCRFAAATDALVVAEGIETDGELAAAVGCGAHLLQGYRIGKPSTDPDQVAAWTRARLIDPLTSAQ